MDEENISDLKERFPKNGKAKILLLGDFDSEGPRIIRDPYYVSNLCNSLRCSGGSWLPDAYFDS